ncbi:MAG: magnesium transporter CorA family protein [Clostridia bacterium]|nr:magnesium transporter CorA family protein [Clostridia bacterium]
MVSYYKTVNGRIEEIKEYEPGCWVNCVAPEDDEVQYLLDFFDIPPELLRSALDEEESSHIDSEDDTTLIIIDVPVVEKVSGSITYSTMPIGIMITKSNVITVSLRESTILTEFAEGVVRNVVTNYKTHFVLHIMLRMATKYLQYLKQIDKISNRIERGLRRSAKNKELNQLLDIEKSLVYFSSSLKADEITLEKIMRGRHLKLYEEDQDLLEDVLIEVKQAVDMAAIYLNILNGTMDVFASIISNNLNIVMKIQASLTLLVSVPTVISGLYGMNIIGGLPFDGYWWFPVALSGVLMIIMYIILRKKDMF